MQGCLGMVGVTSPQRVRTLLHSEALGKFPQSFYLSDEQSLEHIYIIDISLV